MARRPCDAERRLIARTYRFLAFSQHDPCRTREAESLARIVDSALERAPTPAAYGALAAIAFAAGEQGHHHLGRMLEMSDAPIYRSLARRVCTQHGIAMAMCEDPDGYETEEIYCGN